MRNLTLGIAFIVALLLSETVQAQENTVEFSILPGPLIVELTLDGDFVVLRVDDATGTSQGWWVTVNCDCTFTTAGEIESIGGNHANADSGPYFRGRTLVAERLHGVGVYRVKFTADPGTWLLSYGQGEMPSI